MQEIRRFLNSKAFSEIRISAVFWLNIVFSLSFRRRNPKKSIHSWLRASNSWRELHLHSFPRTTFLVLHGERDLPTHLRKLRFQPQDIHRAAPEAVRERVSGGGKKGEEEKKREGGGALAVESGRESTAMQMFSQNTANTAEKDTA